MHLYTKSKISQLVEYIPPNLLDCLNFTLRPLDVMVLIGRLSRQAFGNLYQNVSHALHVDSSQLIFTIIIFLELLLKWLREIISPDDHHIFPTTVNVFGLNPLTRLPAPISNPSSSPNNPDMLSMH